MFEIVSDVPLSLTLHAPRQAVIPPLINPEGCHQLSHTVLLLQVTFTGNAATSPLGVSATLGNGVGGALYVEGATDAFNVTGCRFQRNSAQVGL